MQPDAQAAPVTPEGVRSGDPSALAALVERRGGAVMAYCREVCEPADAPLAAAEALARFRAAVWASGEAAGVDPERLMLSATRHASAARARKPAEASATRRILGRAHTETCARVPALIVARAESLLGDADLDRLSRHVDRCPSCRSVEAAFRRAERAYVAGAHAPLDSATTAMLLGALAEAAPIEAVAAPAAAPEPEPAPAPEPEPLAQTLPDELEDDDDDGWTGESEPLPLPIADEIYDHPMIEPGPATWGASGEHPRRRRGLRVALPVAVLAAGAIAAMAVAGVFDGGGSPARDTGTVQSTAVAPATSTAARKAHRRRTTGQTNPATVTATP